MILLLVIKQAVVPQKVYLFVENLRLRDGISRRGGKLSYGTTEISITMYMQYWDERGVLSTFSYLTSK